MGRQAEPGGQEAHLFPLSAWALPPTPNEAWEGWGGVQVLPSFTTAERWKQPESPSGDGRRNKMCAHKMEYYSALKKKEVLQYTRHG